MANMGMGNTVERVFSLAVIFLLAVTMGCAASGKSKTAEPASGKSTAGLMQPMVIPDDAPCGKCGMYPARYPQWQSQIIFKDGSMTPFDGCKCMFNFLFAMGKYDKMHANDDVEVAWVKDFNTGEWLNAKDAHYVVGSKVMGPMGKELIPFADSAAAAKFHQEQGGSIMMYSDINPDVMKTLGMGGMQIEKDAKDMKM